MRLTRALPAWIVATVLAVVVCGPAASAAPSQLPQGVPFGFEVYDREAGETVVAGNEHERFRSASLVKLLIALDYLRTLGASDLPAEDRALLVPMLRSSDDTAASILWVRGGFDAVITRMVDAIGLVDTEPPADRRFWGYTAVSAADVVAVYNYLLDEAPKRDRALILGNLRRATRCASDGFDQYFGIPRAVPRPWAVKQGWSGFGSSPPAGQECGAPGRAATPPVPLLPFTVLAAAEAPPNLLPAVRAENARSATSDVDLTHPAMHTSGLVDHDRTIVVVLTLQPAGTTWRDSGERVTGLTRVLYLASQSADPTAEPVPPQPEPPAALGLSARGQRRRAASSWASA